MDFLDFFSESPKVYIFKKETNKTKFGGFLFLIFIIVMIIISLAYILDYALNNSYKVEYTRYFNNSLSSENKIRFPSEIDKEISFKFNIRNQVHDPIIEAKDEFAIFFDVLL